MFHMDYRWKEPAQTWGKKVAEEQEVDLRTELEEITDNGKTELKTGDQHITKTT